MSFIRAFFITLLVVFSATSFSHAEHRVALLIGNSDYPEAELQSPSKDIRAVGKALENRGFRTTLAEDLRWDEMREVVERFARSVPTCGTALVYFSGYTMTGTRNGKEEDCFLALDTNTQDHRRIANQGYGQNRLMELLEERCGAKNILVLVDGCYLHPKSRKDSQLDPPKELLPNMFIGYGNEPDDLQPPPKEGLSSFAARIVKALNDKELTPIDALRFASSWSRTTLPESVKLAEPASKVIAPPDQFTEGKNAGDEWVNSQGMVFCWCPPGTYVMGSPMDEEGRLEDEKQVVVEFQEGFWISKYEVTIRENPRGRLHRDVLGRTKNHPVTLINWDDASRMVKKTLTEAERKAGCLPNDWEYDLPTQEEWEYAARAGTKTRFSFGDDEKLLPLYGNFADKSLYDTGDLFYNYAHRSLDDGIAFVAPVGSYRPNPWGLHDVHGNVAEWCAGTKMRGGSFLSLPNYCRSAQKNSWPNRQEQNFLGFRFVIRKKSATKGN